MIRVSMKNDGFEGILFLGNGSKDKVIIVMSGSNGGMSMAKMRQSSTIRTAFRLCRLRCSRQSRLLPNW